MNQDQLEMQRDRFKLLSELEVLGGSLNSLALPVPETHCED